MYLFVPRFSALPCEGAIITLCICVSVCREQTRSVRAEKTHYETKLTFTFPYCRHVCSVNVCLMNAGVMRFECVIKNIVGIEGLV